MKNERSLSDSSFMAQLTTGKLLEKDWLTQTIVRLRIKDQYTANISKPGQFVNIKVTDNLMPLLRRPFSINGVNRDQAWFDILFQVIGKGTRMLAAHDIGEEINFLGPLGNHFTIDGKLNQAVLVAGGLGIAPLIFLIQALRRQQIPILLFWGNSTKDGFVGTEVFHEYGVKTYFATDDGSLGFHGTVAELLETKISATANSFRQIFTCGPNPMLRRIQRIAQQHHIDCQMSLETTMACGFGVCMGCNVVSTSESEKYKYVCKDGPVFNAKDIVISE